MKKRLFSVALILALALIVAPVAFAQTQYNSCVENEGADISVTLPGSFTTANTALPDPFKKIDGNRITAKDEWKNRRAETLRLLERTVYGTKPPKPATVTGTVSKNSISVSVTENGKTVSFSATVTLPSGNGPFPAVIQYGSGASDGTLRGWGVATITMPYDAIGSETGSRTSKKGHFYTIYGSNSKAGLLVAWAWGVSRIIDVIQASDGSILKWDAIGVTGCSRLGKAAFVSGVLDQRVALTIPMESGSGGMNIMRGAYKDRDQSGGSNGAQSPQSAYNETYWLGDDFNAFTSNPNNLPVDIHQSVALIAPRGLFVMDKTAASAGQWLNIPSSHASAKAGAEVYKALGAGGNLHYMNTPTNSHCTGQNNFDTQLKDFVDKFLLRTKAVGTDPLFTENSPPSMTSWINWTTPPLSGTLTLGCGSTPTPTPKTFKLTVTYLPATIAPVVTGTVTASPTAPTSGRYDSATVVKLTAVPASAYQFDGWGGDASGTKDTVSVIMNADKTVTATFNAKTTGIARDALYAKNKRGLTVTAVSNSALNVSFTAKNSGAASINLYSLKGDLLASAKVQTTAGAYHSHTINAAKLSTGFYVVKVSGDGFTEQARAVMPR